MRRAWIFVLGLTILAAATSLLGQQKTVPAAPGMPAEQAIDIAIGEMLGAWQIGDAEMLHRYFDESVSVVSGDFEPPIYGWTSYVQAYRRQRERLQQVRLERRNTYVNIRGSWAWAAYQWEFLALVDGTQTGARGHTTLVLEKKGERWLIVHNHTSVISQAAAPPAQAPAPPAKPQR